MKELLKRINSFFKKNNATYLQNEALKRLRSDNPSCTILSASLIDVKLGNQVGIHEGVYLSQTTINNFSYISKNSKLFNVNIGKFCSIGPHVQIGLAPHPSRVFVSTCPAFYSNNNSGSILNLRDDKIFDDSIPKTKVENDVWIGSNAIIPGGIAIGTGAIIAAGSIVVKDVPPYAIVGGNPAQIVRYRFSNEQIQLLLSSEWWDWPIEKIRNNVDIFSDLEKFKSYI